MFFVWHTSLYEYHEPRQTLGNLQSTINPHIKIPSSITRDIDNNEIIEIDFSGVQVLAPSWADEVIMKLAKQFPHLQFINANNATVQATLKTLQQYSGVKVK